MQATISVFILFFLLGMLSYYLMKSKAKETQFAEEFSIFSNMIYKINSFLNETKPRPSAQDFQAWATNMDISKVSAKEFKSWLNSLEMQEVIEFAKQVSVYCHDHKIELAWLTSEELNYNPELKEAISEIITLYSLANFKAHQIADDIKAWRAFQNWQQNPNSKEQHEFGRLLLAKLMEAQLVPPMSPDFLLALKKERQQEAIASIRLAAEKNPQAFHSILKSLVDTTKQAEPTPQPKSTAAL